MDDNLSSESICSDDTEYLLGQNVSIREIDEFDLKPNVFNKIERTEITSLKYNEDRQSPRIRNESRKGLYMIDSSAQRKEEKSRALTSDNKLQESDLLGYQERGKVKYPAQSSGKEATTKHHSSKKTFSEPSDLGREKKGSLGKLSQGKAVAQHSAQQGKPRKHTEEERRMIGDRKQGGEHKDKSKQRMLYDDKRVDLTRGGSKIVKTEAELDQRKGWRQRDSPVHFEKSLNREVYEGEEIFDSPEQADVGSMASEATEDLLKQDDELDGSIIEKLKELNLAVSYDADTQELDDYKVKEGAQLLSKLFGGSIDNYYSSPSGHSGSASGQESLRGESQTEEKRNISNASSKGSSTSFTNTESLHHTPDETKKNLQRKTKVSFATDESTSFDSSPRVVKRQTPEKMYEDSYGPSVKQDVRYNNKSDGYGGFIRETSALRAAMDYDDDEDEDDDERYKSKLSPSRSSDIYRESESNVVRGYQKEQQKQRHPVAHRTEERGELGYSTEKVPNSVNSPHNKVVTDYITKQLKAKGHDEIKVERAAKKFHEHIRRVAQGKVDDDVKARMRMANRKSRKFLQRKRCLDPEKEKEVGAFNALSKDHMSSDEEDPHDKNQWLSRPPTYRSETLQRFLNKLDKAHNKRASKEAKFAKKIKRVVGEPKEVDPPENTPVWALSRTWLEHRERSMNQYKVERYSDSGTRIKAGEVQVDSEPLWDGFYTSTPHKNAQKSGSPGTSGKLDSSDIERKLYLEKKLHETENQLNKSSKELLEIQNEVDKALMKKKVALEEVQVLDDKLKRTRDDIKTSENLAEQYRQQVTKTRSELMDLEVERDSTRQDIKEMENILIKQKQEANETFKVDKKNERKVLELSLDNNKLQREVEILKAKLEQAESTLENETKLQKEKIGMLQEQFRDGQRSLEETIQRLRKQLEDERNNARSSHYERIQSLQKFQDESKENQEREIEAVKTRLTRENEAQLEKMQEKTKREIDGLTRKIQDGEFRISHLENTLREKSQEIDVLKTRLLEEKQTAYDNETNLKEENSKLENYAKALKTEVDSLRQREANLSASNRTLEQSYDEKIQETRRLQDKIQNQVEESSKLQENREDEIQMLRGLVRQQEDATRLLGEKLRTEAQEQIRSALQREREAIDKEREKQKEKLEEIKSSYDDILKQVRAELEEERTSHHQLQTAALKMKKEIEKLRESNLHAQEEKVNTVAQLRSESKEQIIKLKDKIQELALFTDRNEKDIVLEINEECRRVAAVIGGSPNTTPIKSNSLSSSFTGSFTGRESPGSNTNSPARDALANLKSCNAELRQHLIEARREIEYQSRNESLRKQPDSADLTHQQISLFKKALRSKDDEIARLKRQLQEDTNKSMAQFKSERAVMQKTIDRLEKDLRETKKLIPASSPIVNGHHSLENTSTSGMGTSISSCASPRPGEDSSTSRLLRHLQGRVQQLRAQNDSLRSDSLNESHSSVSTVDSTYVDGADDRTNKLHTALQLSDQRANRNAAMLSQKMLEMTKLQKMLTHATKENMKLERAYASLQQRIIDTSP